MVGKHPGWHPTTALAAPGGVLCCRYAEKQVGYVACSVFLNEVRRLSKAKSARVRTKWWGASANAAPCARLGAVPPLSRRAQKDEFLRLVINSVRNDLISRNEAFQCLALDFIANGEGARPLQGWAGRGADSEGRRAARARWHSAPHASPDAPSPPPVFKPSPPCRAQWVARSLRSC